MKHQEINIPPFVQDYMDKLGGKDFSDFVRITAEYQQEKEKYPDKFAEQSAHLNDYNRRTGQINHLIMITA